MRDGIHRLRTSSLSVEEAARLAGYHSVNKFYQRLKWYTYLRPSQIRTLPDETLARLLDQRLSLRRLATLDVPRAGGFDGNPLT